jgi:hypothetical protein
MDSSQWDTKNLEVFWSQTAPALLTVLPFQGGKSVLLKIDFVVILRNHQYHLFLHIITWAKYDKAHSQKIF